MSKLASAGVVALICAFASPAMAEEWRGKIFENDWQPIESWLNTDCKTKDPSGISAVVSQSGNDYNIVVFCRQDNDESRQWKMHNLAVTGGQALIDSVTLAKSSGSWAIIGFVNTAEPTHDLIIGSRVSQKQ